MSELRKKLYEALGFSIVSLIIVCASIAAVYAIIGEFTDAGRHWLATGLIFAVPLAFALGYRNARSHITGVERGLSIGSTARRPIVAARPAPAAPAPVDRWADLPPDSGGLQIKVHRANADQIVDM